MKKRLISLALAAALLLGLAPAAALADHSRSQLDSFMSIAAAQTGYREQFGNGTKYGEWYGLPNQPWCAMFISWCARKAGVPLSVIPNFAGCNTGGMSWFKSHGVWRGPDYTPKRGDLLFIDALEDDGVTRDGLAEHVAIVERVTEDTIYTIEGNTVNDMAERRERPRDESVLGFGTPNYGSISQAAGEIRIENVVSPSGVWNGAGFNISGSVSSDSRISWLYADIRDAADFFYSSAQTAPMSRSADLKSLDSRLKFGKLGPGSYELYVEAVDENYNFVCKTYPFKVGVTDVDADGEHRYYAEAIQWAVDNGVSNGEAGGKFKPDGLCTRAQVVTFLWRAAGLPAPESDECAFSDVSDSNYYAKPVQWALEQGIALGVDKTHFNPDGVVTRAQFVTFLWRYLGSPDAGTDNTFRDVSERAYYFAPVQWAAENGVTTGTSHSAFSPSASATRAQVVTFIYRAVAQT